MYERGSVGIGSVDDVEYSVCSDCEVDATECVHSVGGCSECSGHAS